MAANAPSAAATVTSQSPSDLVPDDIDAGRDPSLWLWLANPGEAELRFARGHVQGAAAFMASCPARKFAVVLLANLEHADREPLSERIAEIYSRP